jgi:hypothetical protein
VKQVKTETTKTTLIVDYSVENDKTVETEINLETIKLRLKEASVALGREVTEEDMKDIIKSIVNCMRIKENLPDTPCDVHTLINLDLEDTK